MTGSLTHGQRTPGKFLHWTIFIFAALLGIELGAAAFTSVVVFPVWTASPEAAIAWTPGNPYHMEEGDFFMFASPSVMLASIIALIASWRAAPQLRFWLRIASILFIVIFVWSMVYFVPIQDTTLKGEAGANLPREELASKLRMFASLNYIRIAAIVVSFGCTLHALGLSYQIRNNRR